MLEDPEYTPLQSRRDAFARLGGCADRLPRASQFARGRAFIYLVMAPRNPAEPRLTTLAGAASPHWIDTGRRPR